MVSFSSDIFLVSMAPDTWSTRKSFSQVEQVLLIGKRHLLPSIFSCFAQYGGHMEHYNTKHPGGNFIALWSVERFKEFIRRGQRQKQPGEEVRRTCWEDEEDMSTVVGLRRVIAYPTAVKDTEI